MSKKTILWSLLTIFLLSVAGAADAQSPEENLRKNFPKLKFETVTPSPVKGMYEVLTGNDVLYYVPETQNIIAGNIFTKDGRNLTQEKRSELNNKRLEIIKDKQKDIPLDKGIKMGSGPHKIIEFSNPDCSYCRKASKYLAERTDITRYIFFLPFSPQTENKVKYILCATDKTKAYEEAMTGKLDEQKFPVCDSKEVEALLKAHTEAARQLGIDSTPFFFIDGQIVQGADMPVIEKLLGKTEAR